MKNFAKVAFGALLLAGAATAAASTPAEAGVSVGIGIGGPVYGGYYAPPVRYNYCDRYSRYYDPYRCDGYYAPAYYGYGPAYYGPTFAFGFGGGYHGGFHGGGFHGGFHHR